MRSKTFLEKFLYFVYRNRRVKFSLEYFQLVFILCMYVIDEWKIYLLTGRAKELYLILYTKMSSSESPLDLLLRYCYSELLLSTLLPYSIIALITGAL